MMVQIIHRPSDLESTLDAALCRFNCWAPPPGPPESVAIEQIIDGAFAERARSRFRAERAMHSSADAGVTDWLEALAEPLERLTDQGYQLVAVLSRTSLPRPAERGLDMADYLVAPDPCYFRPTGGEFAAPIHALGSDCPVGHGLIVGDAPPENVRTFEIWMSPESVVRDFELSVPWCPRCTPDVGGLASS
jgi:hypothetical protein